MPVGCRVVLGANVREAGLGLSTEAACLAGGRRAAWPSCRAAGRSEHLPEQVDHAPVLPVRSPIPASSGQTRRYRLNRRGDRQLNHALHTIAIVRMRDDPLTRAYVQRRTTDGKNPREIRRCLKRIIARQLSRLLERYDQPAIQILHTT